MIDYYLSAADEAAMFSALLAVGAVVLDATHGMFPADGVSIDVIGRWYERTGGTDLAPEMTAVPGWFFNVRSVMPINWPAGVTQTQPSTPWRMFG